MSNVAIIKDRLTRAREILSEEAQALQWLAEGLDENLDNAIQTILELTPHGRVIVSGIGKTGFIGRKISATFSSVGIPSLFLHPAEAAHGDLGRVTSEDIVLILSNSGQTAEILQIIPALKRLGCTIISITGEKDSILARRSDIPISIGSVKEAGPMGLAPTTSTTLMLALGDALVMCVLAEKGFTKEQFALFHPAGMLGRTLMLVSEIMRTGDGLCIVPETLSAREVLHRITLTKDRPGAAAIVDATGVLVGIFTDGDFRRCLDKSANFLELPIKQVMGQSPKTVKPQDLAEEARKLMAQFQIDQVIVIDETRRPVGMVDVQDIVKTG